MTIPNGHILLFYGMIETMVESHNNTDLTLILAVIPDYEHVIWDVSEIYELATLHEIGHSLLYGISDHLAPEGIMSNCTIDDWMSNAYFTLDNIRGIQKNTRIL